MNVVLDTNVLVSALLSPFGAPAQVLNLLLTGRIQPVIDDRILAEYRDVLQRPKFGFELRALDDLFVWFTTESIHVTPTVLTCSLPDPNDIMFLEAAVEANAMVITGNLRHFPPDRRFGIHIVAPAEFIEWWRAH